MTLPALV